MANIQLHIKICGQWEKKHLLFFFIANNYSLTEGNRYIMLLEFLINKTIKNVLQGGKISEKGVACGKQNLFIFSIDSNFNGNYWQMYPFAIKGYIHPIITHKKGGKKSISALGNCSAISTMPQINLDVLHPSGDYMES